MSLQSELDAKLAEIKATFPAEVLEAFNKGGEELVANGAADNAKKVGEAAPVFDVNNMNPEVKEALARSDAQYPLVVTFYRGNWCPYCNIQLRQLEKALPEITAAGGKLLAVAPQKPDFSNSEDAAKFGFPIHYDDDAAVAKAFGVYFELPSILKETYSKVGLDLEKHNGYWGLPIPATYIIGRDGKIVDAFVQLDYTKRMEPSAIVERLKSLQ